MCASPGSKEIAKRRRIAIQKCMTQKAPLNWELCRTFLAVLREGNLSRAARALQLTQPTVGRHIDEIERALGIALFTRAPQGLTPTDAAFELKPHAAAMAA